MTDHRLLIAKVTGKVAKRTGLNANHHLRLWCICMDEPASDPGTYAGQHRSVRQERTREQGANDPRRLGAFDHFAVVDMRVPNSAIEAFAQHVKEKDEVTHHRPGWDEYFLGIARAVSARGECVRARVGCVLVRDRRIVSTGYNGVAAGEPSCLDGACPRGLSGVARRSEGGPGYEVAPCVAFHAEDNAVTDAYARGLDPRGCTAYLTKEPCPRCRTMLSALDIVAVWFDDTREIGGILTPGSAESVVWLP